MVRLVVHRRTIEVRLRVVCHPVDRLRVKPHRLVGVPRPGAELVAELLGPLARIGLLDHPARLRAISVDHVHRQRPREHVGDVVLGRLLQPPLLDGRPLCAATPAPLQPLFRFVQQRCAGRLPVLQRLERPVDHPPILVQQHARQQRVSGRELRVDPDRLAQIRLGQCQILEVDPAARPHVVGLRLIGVALEVGVDAGDRLADLRPHRGGILGRLVQPLLRQQDLRPEGDELLERQVAFARTLPFGGNLALRLSTQPLLLRAIAEPLRDEDGRQEEGRHRRRDGARERLPARDELPRPVEDRGRMGENRLARQPSCQVVREGARRGVAPGGVLLEALHHDRVEVGIDFRIAPPDRQRLFIHDRLQDLQHRPFEGRPVAQQFVQRGAQPVNVAARVRALAQGLLRTHVRRRSDHHAGDRKRAAHIGARGKAEVQHEEAVAVDHQVQRLEIAMDHAAPVRVMNRERRVADQFDEPPHVLSRVGRQRLAVDELHGDEGSSVDRPRFVDGGDIGVVQLSGGLRLAEESRDFGRILVLEEFQRDPAVELRIVRFPDFPHPARAELLRSDVPSEAVPGRGLRRRAARRRGRPNRLRHRRGEIALPHEKRAERRRCPLRSE